MSRLCVYSLLLVTTILAVPTVDAQADSGARPMVGADARVGVTSAQRPSSITGVVVPDSSDTRVVKTDADGGLIAVTAGQPLPLDVSDGTGTRKSKAATLGFIGGVVLGALISGATYESSCTAVVIVCPELLDDHTSAEPLGFAGLLNVFALKLFGMKARNSGIPRATSVPATREPSMHRRRPAGSR